MLPVGTLPQAEAATLARELPALRALMFDGQPPALGRISRSGQAGSVCGRRLTAFRGIPACWNSTMPRYPRRPSRSPGLSGSGLSEAIGEWAAATLAVLPLDAKLMAWFVAGLEPLTAA